LRGLPSFAETVLFPFFGTRVPGEIAFHFERMAILRVEFTQRPGDA
jgi:hypothetical protein